MQKNPKIRKAAAKDIPEIILLLKKLNAFEKRIAKIAAYRKGFEKAEARQLRKKIRSAQHAVIVAESQGKIVGFCNTRIDNWQQKFEKKKWIEINEVFIEKEYRKQGIATKMIRTAEHLLKGKFDGTELFVLNGNKQAKKLYKKLGYKETIALFLKEN